MESLEVLVKGSMIHNRQGINIPGRSLAMVNASAQEFLEDQVFEVKPNFLLTNEHPNLIMVPMLHIALGRKQSCISLAIINLNEDENIFLKKGEILGHLEPCPIEIGEIIKKDWEEICLLYTSPSPRDATLSRMPSSA